MAKEKAVLCCKCGAPIVEKAIIFYEMVVDSNGLLGNGYTKDMQAPENLDGQFQCQRCGRPFLYGTLEQAVEDQKGKPGPVLV